MKLKHIWYVVGVWMAATALSVSALELPPSVQVAVELPGGEFLAYGYKEEGIDVAWEKTPHTRITFPFYQDGYVKIYSKAFPLDFVCIMPAENGAPFMEYHVIPSNCSDKPSRALACQLDKQKTYLCSYYPSERFAH